MQSKEDVDNAIVSSWAGIMLAGGCYPITLFFAAILIATIRSGPDPMMANYIGQLCIGLMAAFVVGCLCAGLVGLAAGTITIIFNWSFGGIFSPRHAVIINGGMTGFIATFPVGLGMLEDVRLIGTFLWVTPLAMLMGYIGGITMVSWIGVLKESRPADKNRRKYRFQIRDMFVATFWFAVVFAIERLVGDFMFTIWISTGVGLLFVLIGIDRIWLWFRTPKIDSLA